MVNRWDRAALINQEGWTPAAVSDVCAGHANTLAPVTAQFQFWSDPEGVFVTSCRQHKNRVTYSAANASVASMALVVVVVVMMTMMVMMVMMAMEVIVMM